MTGKLPKVTTKKNKRKGRGYGSGKGGHTSGRGMKGQKSRKKLGVLFEGIKMKKSFIKRLPLRRGKGKFKSKDKPIIIKLEYLNLLPSGSKVDLDTLIKHNIVKKEDAKTYGVKILGDGKLKKKFKIFVPISKSASKKVIKLGGQIESSNSKKEKKDKKKEAKKDIKKKSK